MNAKKELLAHAAGRTIQYVQIRHMLSYDEEQKIAGELSDILPRLDFEYDCGYGMQCLEGTVWYTDGTWSERAEYDGSEWWAHRECPPLPNYKHINTPRTDAAARSIDGFADQWVPRYVSEELEKELKTANDYVDRLVEHKDMVCLPADLANLRNANAHFAIENEKLKKQRDEALEQSAYDKLRQ